MPASNSKVATRCSASLMHTTTFCRATMCTYSADLRGDVGWISKALVCQSQFVLAPDKLEAAGAGGGFAALLAPSLEASGMVSVGVGVAVVVVVGAVGARLGVSAG